MNPVCYCVMVLALVMVCSPFGLTEEPEETFGCEANATGNPIGGGEGYSDIFTKGDFTVTTKEELLAALKEARAGQVIFVPDGVEIDLTGQQRIAIPQGVTLAGTRGLNGSAGARIFTTWRKSHGLMYAAGREVRITGLRFEGAYGGTEKVADHSSFCSLGHYRCEIDNCEVYNFNVVGIGVGGLDVHVHHNHIHHCQRSGYGYGVATNGTNARIIANKFNACRHHIASGGAPGSGYEAAWNLIGPEATSHHFDMHGGRDRGDNTDIAGDWLHIHHNTFENTTRQSIVIRGVPSQGAEIHHNWFLLVASKNPVVSRGNTRVYDNVYGPDKTPQEKPIEF